ncbi:MAG: tRNA guanosine(15) transglycosylase TgtA [Candidatus Bathyarchaeia archaeon]|jgi:7-cyano-7-deazaguanine tRNA-ribosyltransferase|nr:tRNA guanosine(15) transglycosylase TgtA [Candidatus Bathyarchaeota archaeon A05DMB-4]MDH7595043.1 tRNA guanosine(15) transglycosylase TgtA [Candidatus Bathyarchaeota archaeon]
MSFEVREKDILGRIGRLETKCGIVETPVLLPVINPRIQPLKPKDMQEKLGCKALITNAYILKKHYAKEAVEKGVHKILDYNGVVMTDSGAYQILIYGDVQIDPEEIVHFQEQIDTDIATILDTPTGWKVSKEYAEKTVKKTLHQAKRLWKIKTRPDIAWVGPVQGGQHLTLVAKSAKEIGKLPFQIHALGNPTAVMEQYLFDVLVDMIMAAKINLPLERPLHLFGAGHPFMFSLAVALGCDMFDSAAYILYAREGRYMTEHGTARLNELEYFPCSCPICTRNSPADLLAKPREEKQRLLAEHNLYVSFAELRRIKQAIREGRLWEHLEMHAHSHPALLQAVKHLKKYEDYLEKHSPVTKNCGLFFYNSVSLNRPEVVRHRKRILERYTPPKDANVLILLPQTQTKPFSKSREWRSIIAKVRRELDGKSKQIHVCTYAAPFGIVPNELDEVYPLSQHEVAVPLDKETIQYVGQQVQAYVTKMGYKKVILLENNEPFGKTITNLCRQACRKNGISFLNLHRKNKTDKTVAQEILDAIKSG